MTAPKTLSPLSMLKTDLANKTIERANEREEKKTRLLFDTDFLHIHLLFVFVFVESL